MGNNTVYEIITDKIIQKLETGNVPWVKTWKGIPCNYESERPYSGENLVLLFAEYGSPYWLTWHQIQKLNGRVKKGEKASYVVFWKLQDITKEETNDKGTVEIKNVQIPFLRYYLVWNLEQTEGIKEKASNQKIKTCDEIITGAPVLPIIEPGLRASYNPASDKIQMPALNTFSDSNAYYSTLFHELTHWTGHESRLNRLTTGNLNFGSEIYSKEELIAELGAAFLCATTGIQNDKIFDNSAAYVQNWLKVLKNDKKLIVQASSEAQKAVNYILNTNKSEAV
jgi:antirestriction protein ArdC